MSVTAVPLKQVLDGILLEESVVSMDADVKRPGMGLPRDYSSNIPSSTNIEHQS